VVFYLPYPLDTYSFLFLILDIRFLKMEVSAIRDKMQEYISKADERHLTAIYILVEKEIEPDYLYDKEMIDALYERRERHLNGTSRSYSVEESLELIRKHKM
jgi:hypothetical protein